MAKRRRTDSSWGMGHSLAVVLALGIGTVLTIKACQSIDDHIEKLTTVSSPIKKPTNPKPTSQSGEYEPTYELPVNRQGIGMHSRQRVEQQTSQPSRKLFYKHKAGEAVQLLGYDGRPYSKRMRRVLVENTEYGIVTIMGFIPEDAKYKEISKDKKILKKFPNGRTRVLTVGPEEREAMESEFRKTGMAKVYLFRD